MKKIKFINMGVDPFFISFIKYYIDKNVILDENNLNIIICSVFGPRANIINFLKNNTNCTSIFFTGESVDHPSHKQYNDYMLDYVDIALGFDYLNHPKYIRFPLWLTYINLDSNLGKYIYDIKKYIKADYNKKFTCILNNHDGFNTRTSIFNKLNQYKKIDSGGKWNNNINYSIPQGENYKYKWLSTYKFNICCESIIKKGYITEKLFEAILSGCIPIYLVNNINDKIEDDILNQKRILKYTNSNIDDIINYIIELDNNKLKYEQFFNQPIFTDNAIDIINNKYNILKQYINKLYNVKK